MTSFSLLNISRIRNIDDIRLEPIAGINLIQGMNGSGKTSILESIHMLATGRSFRSTKTSPVIQNGSNECTLYGELGEGSIAIGLQKFRNQKHLLKLQGKKQANWIEVARHLPVQVLDSTAFQLLEGSPKVRRRFLDWGVFHVEPSFVQHWSNSRKCIANRNLLLRAGSRCDRAQLAAWSQELCVEADHVNRARVAYFNELSPVLDDVLRKVSPVSGLSLTYFKGWDDENPLNELLDASLDSDLRYGATQFGPHRADIRVKLGRNQAVEVLSRGQQKMLVSAMKIAQGILLSERTQRRCIFLLDDLPAELDEMNRRIVCRILQSLESQIFITCVDERSLNNCWESTAPLARFHVEHGKMHHRNVVP